MEYLLIIGFSMFMLIPILVLYGGQKQEINDRVNMDQAVNVQQKIVDAAQTVYFLGKPAKTTLKVYMPEGIRQVGIDGQYIYFMMPFLNMEQNVSTYSAINLSGSLPTRQGIQYIEITADDYQVNISNKEV